MSESTGHLPVVAGTGEATGGLVPPVALTAGSAVPFWPNGPGMPAGGGAGRVAGGPAGIIAGGDGAGVGATSIRVGSSWSHDPRDEDLVAYDGQAGSGSGITFLLAAQRGLGLLIPLRPVVEPRDRTEIFAAADRVEVRELTVKAPLPEWDHRQHHQTAAEGLIGIDDGEQLLAESWYPIKTVLASLRSRWA